MLISFYYYYAFALDCANQNSTAKSLLNFFDMICIKVQSKKKIKKKYVDEKEIRLACINRIITRITYTQFSAFYDFH